MVNSKRTGVVRQSWHMPATLVDARLAQLRRHRVYVGRGRVPDAHRYERPFGRRQRATRRQTRGGGP